MSGTSTVTTPHGRLHVRDVPGDGPAIVMTHGFPDDSRIYDRLIPELGAVAWSPSTSWATGARTASTRPAR